MTDRIAILLPDLRGGGAERVNINLANEFVARGFSVDMVLMRACGDFVSLLDRRVRVVELGEARMRYLFRPLVSYLRETRPAALLACMWPLTIIAVVAVAVSRVKARLVLAEHTTWSVSEQSRAKTRLFNVKATMRILFPRADGVVAVSRGAAEDLARVSRLPLDRVATIYNPIVGGSKLPVDEDMLGQSWSSGAHRKVLAVGTLKAIKDYRTLLHAFATLRKSVDAKLLILGEGEERGELTKLIASLGIAADVFLPGFVANPELYYQRADLHVLSSIGEGLPTVLVEALEHGVPVVSTDCPSGPREILGDGRYGTLVPVGDSVALSRAMHQSLLREHDLSALKSRAAVFNVERAADSYLDLLLPDWRKASLVQMEVLE